MLWQSQYIFEGCEFEDLAPTAEERFLERLKRGDNDAFDQLYEEYKGLVYNLAFRILGEQEEALDLTQEVFLSVFKHVNTFNGSSSLQTWIYRITLNSCLNRTRWWRRRKRDSTIPISEIQHRRGGGNRFEIRDRGSSPEALAFRSELERMISKRIVDLPHDQRVAVVLRDVEGLSYEEIAEMLRISRGTVKSRIARGREALRNQLCGVL